MDLQELLIDGIGWLKNQIEKCEPGQMRMDMEAKLEQWQGLAKTDTPPNCPTGYYWNGTACVKDVG